MGGDRLRDRSESPGRPGKVLPSSPGAARVAHGRNPGHHRRAGSPLSGTLAHSQRNDGSQRPQYPLRLYGEPGGPTSITGTARSALATLYIVITFLSRHTESWILVIYSRYVYQPGYTDGGLLTSELLPAIAQSGPLAAGSWDAEILDELKPQTGDIVIDKSRYSAFYGTRLEPTLTAQSIRSLVVAGVTTNMCVETTVRDASQRDYRPFVVSDASGELDANRHRHALNTIGFGFGWVTTVDEVCSAWAGAGSR
jgi:ureidoacrylate peracid hydrolase